MGKNDLQPRGEYRWEREGVQGLSSGSGVKRSGRLGEIGKEDWKEVAHEEKRKPGEGGILEDK